MPDNQKDKNINEYPDKSWKRFLNFLKTEDGKLTIDIIFRALKAFAPNAWVAFWDFMLVCIFLGTIILCSAYGWIEKRTTETLLVLIVGTIIGAKFKEK